MRMWNFKANNETATVISFKEGTYNKSTGLANTTLKNCHSLWKN
jgi:hypothetical protein